MPLQLGTTLGVYEVLSAIGAGGMGEVYKARDTKLDRDVALKILPDAFVNDPERLARFQREAKVLASLNHPNIAAIYGLEESGDSPALVLEYVPGPTLQDRIAKGPIPLDEALPIARQIAEALEAAHEQGIIHRDLKPANVKVKDDGTVKVLDFGLAKALGPELSDTEAANSPTMTMTAAATKMGVIMGTAAYMSPEQARGKSLDRRCDIWAFGCVLYEMLTGQPAFDGDDVSLILAEVIKSEPDWGRLADDTPESIRGLLERCLEKDRNERLPHIGEARFQVRKALTTSAVEPTGASRALPRHQFRWAGAGLVAGILVAIAAGMVVWRVAGFDTSAPAPLRRLTIDLQEGMTLPAGVGTAIAISPDSQTFVYAAQSAEGRRLYRRRMDEFRAVPIPGTEGATMPFFSPDGEWIAFSDASVTEIKRVPLAGGEPFTICERCADGSWGEDGSIVYEWNRSVFRVSENGGSPELLAEPMLDRGVPALIRVSLLPGSKALLFDMSTTDVSIGGVGVMSLESRELIVVSSDGGDPFYSQTGHILFARGTTLFAVPFDVERLQVAGQPTPVLAGVRVENGGSVQAVVSRDGLLFYAPSQGEVGTQLAWVTRDGAVASVIEEGRRFATPRVSPDGERIAVQINAAGGSDIWIHESGTTWRLTDSGVAANPIWAADGAEVAYGSRSAESFTIESAAADGTGGVRTLVASDAPVSPAAWSPDGNLLVFQEDSPNPKLFVIDVRDPASREAYAASESSTYSATLSHSGRWLAYVSDRSGTDEVYVRAFPGPGREYLISRGGGFTPLWGPGDSELSYLSPDFRFLMAARLDSQSLEVLDRRELFPARTFWSLPWGTHHDIHPDGQRFLMLNQSAPDRTAPKVSVVLNWHQELQARVPTGQ